MALEEVIPGAGTEVVDPPEETTSPSEPTGAGAAEEPETPGASEPAVEAGAEPEIGKPEPGAEPEELEADGRKVLDVNLKKGIAELAKTDKAAAKAVRDAYFGRQAVLKETGAKNLSEAITKIRETKNTIDALGGQEGITEMQNEVADYRKEIEQFANGERGLLEQLDEANPEGLDTAATNALGIIKEKRPAAFDMILLPEIIERLDKANFGPSLVRLSKFIQDGKGQEAYDLVAEIGKWYADTKKLGEEHASKRVTKDPKADALAARERAADDRDRNAYERTIATEVTRLNNRSLARESEPLFRQLKLDGEGRREFINGLQSRVYNAMRLDKTFQRDLRNIIAKGDPQTAAEFNARKFSELLPDQFRKHRNALYPNLAKVTPAPGTKPGADGKPGAAKPGPVIQVKPGTKPNHEDVDWNKTSDTQWISGKGITLKNGKVINVDWNKVAP
jgi:hypothetical protein